VETGAATDEPVAVGASSAGVGGVLQEHGEGLRELGDPVAGSGGRSSHGAGW
jgi:hypothetical protein